MTLFDRSSNDLVKARLRDRYADGTFHVMTRVTTLTTGPRAYTVRTYVTLTGARLMSDKTYTTIARILADLPGYVDGHAAPDGVVAFWSGAA